MKEQKIFDAASEQRVIAIGQAMIAAAKAECERLGSNSAEVAEAADHVASITSTALIEHVEKTIGKEKAMYMAHLFANIYRDRAADFMVTYAKLHKGVLEDDKLKREAKEKKMREIKFRGKSNEFGSVPKNRWVYGDLRTKDGHVTIEDNVYGLLVGVDRDTVGQFTGLRDSNGVEVYEGDVLRSSDGKRDYFFCVFFDDCEMAWKARRDDGYSCLLNAFTGCQEQWEIAGNIHDNPG